MTEEDIKTCSVEEHDVIDRLYDRGTTLVGVLDKNIVESKGCPSVSLWLPIRVLTCSCPYAHVPPPPPGQAYT